MPETGIYILTGPIRSGKTSSLIEWSRGRNDVYGILTPDICDKRVFMDAHTGEQFPMETIGEKEIVSIGKFVFSKKNFDKASQIIRDAIHKSGWLIIDEIGPLELRSEGFHDILKEVLDQRGKKILLVIREGLAEKVKDYFGISKTLIITDPKLFYF